MERKLAIILAISILSSILILFFLVLFIYRLLRLYKKKQSEFSNGIQLLKLEKEKEVLTTRIEVQEETFQIIGREIHDNINQLLTLSKLNLNTINILNIVDTKNKIENSTKLISESIQGLTNISRTLNTDLIKDIGIKKILNDEIIRIESINSIKINCHFGENIDAIKPEFQLLTFRIAQESIRNAIIHGNANNITINLSICNTTLIFEIIDDGTGFNIGNLSEKPLSQGLKNIEKRVTIAKGILEINSKPGNGTKLKITIPNGTFQTYLK